jgi:hypothetical protein
MESRISQMGRISEPNREGGRFNRQEDWDLQRYRRENIKYRRQNYQEAEEQYLMKSSIIRTPHLTQLNRRTVHNEELHNPHSSSNTIKQKNST